MTTAKVRTDYGDFSVLALSRVGLRGASRGTLFFSCPQAEIGHRACSINVRLSYTDGILDDSRCDVTIPGLNARAMDASGVDVDIARRALVSQLEAWATTHARSMLRGSILRDAALGR